MIIPEKYQCDKCDLVTPNRTDLWDLSVRAQEGAYGVTLELFGKYSVMVCRSCAESMGIRRTISIAKEEQVPAPTIEDLIRQIIEMTTGQ